MSDNLSQKMNGFSKWKIIRFFDASTNRKEKSSVEVPIDRFFNVAKGIRAINERAKIKRACGDAPISAQLLGCYETAQFI